MKVLFIETSGCNGGAERSLRELVSRLLSNSDLDIAVAAPETAEFPACPRYAIPQVRLCRPSPTRRFFRGLKALHSARHAIADAIADFAPDVIHANGIAAILALPSTPDRLVLGHLRDRPKKPFSALAAIKCTKLIAISEPLAEEYRKALPSRFRDKITTLVNGLDLTRFANLPDKATVRERLGLPKDETVIGMVANLVPWKRHDILIGAAYVLKARFPENHIVWVIAGNDLFGEHKRHIERLKATAKAYGLDDRIRWFGNRAPEELFPAFDLLVHPAANEPFGRVIVEAMACGIPVVAHNSGGPSAIIDNGRTGLLVGADNAGAFALGIDYILRHDALRREIAAAAKKTAFSRHSVDRLARDYLDILASRHLRADRP